MLEAFKSVNYGTSTQKENDWWHIKSLNWPFRDSIEHSAQNETCKDANYFEAFNIILTHCSNHQDRWDNKILKEQIPASTLCFLHQSCWVVVSIWMGIELICMEAVLNTEAIVAKFKQSKWLNHYWWRNLLNCSSLHHCVFSELLKCLCSIVWVHFKESIKPNTMIHRGIYSLSVGSERMCWVSNQDKIISVIKLWNFALFCNIVLFWVISKVSKVFFTYCL